MIAVAVLALGILLSPPSPETVRAAVEGDPRGPARTRRRCRPRRAGSSSPGDRSARGGSEGRARPGEDEEDDGSGGGTGRTSRPRRRRTAPAGDPRDGRGCRPVVPRARRLRARDPVGARGGRASWCWSCSLVRAFLDASRSEGERSPRPPRRGPRAAPSPPSRSTTPTGSRGRAATRRRSTCCSCARWRRCRERGTGARRLVDEPRDRARRAAHRATRARRSRASSTRSRSRASVSSSPTPRRTPSAAPGSSAWPPCPRARGRREATPRSAVAPIVILAVVCSLSLATSLLLLVFGPELSSPPTPSTNGYSRSAVGHRALVEVLARVGDPRRRVPHADARRAGRRLARDRRGARPRGRRLRRPDRGRRLDDVLRAGPAVLLVLPKRTRHRRLRERGLGRGRRTSGRRSAREHVLAHAAKGAVVVDAKPARGWEPRPSGRRPRRSTTPRLVEPGVAPRRSSRRPAPACSSARRTWGAAPSPCSPTPTSSRRTASCAATTRRSSSRLVDVARGAKGGTVVVDETLHGYESRPSLCARALHASRSCSRSSQRRRRRAAAPVGRRSGRFGAPAPRAPRDRAREARSCSRTPPTCCAAGGHAGDALAALPRGDACSDVRAARARARRRSPRGGARRVARRGSRGRAASSDARGPAEEAASSPRGRGREDAASARGGRATVHRWREEMIDGPVATFVTLGASGCASRWIASSSARAAPSTCCSSRCSAEGHVLLEGVPGIGEDAARARRSRRASSLQLRAHPVHARPDARRRHRHEPLRLPHERRSRSTKGPIFTELLLADEINRTPPKTQAALLAGDAGARGHARRDDARARRRASWSIATQNPIEQEGTYPLPEAQLDRFLFKVRDRLPRRATRSATMVALPRPRARRCRASRTSASQPVADLAALRRGARARSRAVRLVRRRSSTTSSTSCARRASTPDARSAAPRRAPRTCSRRARARARRAARAATS